jgi:hypothetical protein
VPHLPSLGIEGDCHVSLLDHPLRFPPSSRARLFAPTINETLRACPMRLGVCPARGIPRGMIVRKSANEPKDYESKSGSRNDISDTGKAAMAERKPVG